MVVPLRDLYKRLRTVLPLPPHPYAEQFTSEMDLPERNGADRFVMIASTPRSGSHYLGHMMMDTGEFGVPLEYLSPPNALYWQRRFDLRGADLPRLFHRMIAHRTSANGTFCFKAHWAHFEPMISSIGEMTGGRDIDRIVWILRRNQLSQAVSLTIARQTGAWISGAPERKPARYDYDQIVASAQELRDANLKWQKFLEASYPDQYMLVVYETLLGDADEVERIRTFLGGETPFEKPERTKAQGGQRNAEWKERFTEEVAEADWWILEPPAFLPAGS